MGAFRRQMPVAGGLSAVGHLFERDLLLGVRVQRLGIGAAGARARLPSRPEVFRFRSRAALHRH